MNNASTVEYFIHSTDGNTRIILNHFDSYLQEQLGLESKIRFKIPFYYQRSWICYLNPIANDGVELAFLRANEMSDGSGLLQFKDRKQVAGIEIFDLKSVPWMEVEEIFQEALLLDESTPYKSKRRT